MEMRLDEFKAKILSSLVCSLRNTTKNLVLHVPYSSSMMESYWKPPVHGGYPVSFLLKKATPVVFPVLHKLILCWAMKLKLFYADSL